ncbi:MAG: gluconate 2-dehydrogenase subunit 3 family protein [Xanthomonadales bacterium]|nr:gluconate 2-dehydrogenase subunit 3 family protein [Xanthomonadales bacterium]
MKNSVSGRRRFLVESGKLAGGGWLALNAPMLLAAGHHAAEQQAAHGAWVNISEDEAAGFAAVVDQVIPPDDLPGASEAGAVYFIDNVLGGFLAALAPLLRQGLQDIDRRARDVSAGASGFAALPFDQQTAILQTIEDTPFFENMIFLTHCGLFALPSWGGNTDKAGWKLLGFENLHAWQPPFGYYDAQLLAGEGDHAEG